MIINILGSPSTLIKLIKSDKLTQLLIVVSEVVSDDLHSILTDVTHNTVYCRLNRCATGIIHYTLIMEHTIQYSTLYTKLSYFLVGLSIGGYRIRSVVGQKKMDGARSAPRFLATPTFQVVNS